jgi:hypothetical protein
MRKIANASAVPKIVIMIGKIAVTTSERPASLHSFPDGSRYIFFTIPVCFTLPLSRGVIYPAINENFIAVIGKPSVVKVPVYGKRAFFPASRPGNRNVKIPVPGLGDVFF